jgi:hypothetical protein
MLQRFLPWQVSRKRRYLHFLLSFGFFMTELCAGVASIDQQCFATGLGILIAFFCDSIIRKRLEKHITKVMNGEY